MADVTNHPDYFWKDCSISNTYNFDGIDSSLGLSEDDFYECVYGFTTEEMMNLNSDPSATPTSTFYTQSFPPGLDYDGFAKNIKNIQVSEVNPCFESVLGRSFTETQWTGIVSFLDTNCFDYSAYEGDDSIFEDCSDPQFLAENNLTPEDCSSI